MLAGGKRASVRVRVRMVRHKDAQKRCQHLYRHEGVTRQRAPQEGASILNASKEKT